MKKLKITKDAAKAWEALDAKQYKQVGKAIIGLMGNPTPADSQSLKGAKNGERRQDVGEYRIVYCNTEDAIEVLVVGKRNDDNVYKLWERLK